MLVFLIAAVFVTADIVVTAWYLRRTLAQAAPKSKPAPVVIEAVVVEPEPVSWLASVTLRRIIVHTKDDRSIEGLLLEELPDGIVLKAAKLLEEKSTVPLAGDTWIPRHQVSFVQAAPFESGAA